MIVPIERGAIIPLTPSRRSHMSEILRVAACATLDAMSSWRYVTDSEWSADVEATMNHLAEIVADYRGSTADIVFRDDDGRPVRTLIVARVDGPRDTRLVGIEIDKIGDHTIAHRNVR